MVEITPAELLDEAGRLALENRILAVRLAEARTEIARLTELLEDVSQPGQEETGERAGAATEGAP